MKLRNLGAMNQILHVDLSNNKSWTEEISEDIKELFVRMARDSPLGYYTVKRETMSVSDPYGEENPVIFAGGPLTGTDAPAMRGVVVSTSPLTGGYVDSYYGGNLAQEIKYAGYDALVLKGKADKPVMITIEDDKVEILPAEKYWGLDTFETNHQIKADMNDKTLKIATIGQAGENLIPYALVSCEYNRHAGRGGIGAVMGSKQLKAFSIKGTNTVKIHDLERFDQAIAKARKELEQSEEIEELTEAGTAAALWFCP
ncbi:aldehyde ferredoxin oxidoreductase N-terminal domain-containing protein [Natranaerobius thermophilus]|uniref:aldehyde ferredoxin oxidoreductase N-terminal domain-containing protein n=1 Tax=Natranaerobius thermophilus TaxID=375929 RepID=UPI002F418D08